MQRQKEESEVFLDNARNILDAAENVYFLNGSVEETTILIAPEGSIRVVSGSDWSPESLRVHGARMAYRVSQRDGRVHLEGRTGSRTCLFEAEKPDGAAGLLLANTRHYDLAPAPRLLHGDANGLGILGAGGRGGGERVSRRYVGPGLETELVAWL